MKGSQSLLTGRHKRSWTYSMRAKQSQGTLTYLLRAKELPCPLGQRCQPIRLCLSSWFIVLFDHVYLLMISTTCSRITKYLAIYLPSATGSLSLTISCKVLLPHRRITFYILTQIFVSLILWGKRNVTKEANLTMEKVQHYSFAPHSLPASLPIACPTVDEGKLLNSTITSHNPILKSCFTMFSQNFR